MSYSKFLLPLSNRICELRLKRGLSQSDLAKIIGVSKNTISSYERCEFEPRLEHVYALLVYFECDFFDLFYFE